MRDRLIHALATALGWVVAIALLAVLIPALWVSELIWQLKPKMRTVFHERIDPEQ